MMHEERSQFSILRYLAVAQPLTPLYSTGTQVSVLLGMRLDPRRLTRSPQGTVAKIVVSPAPWRIFTARIVLGQVTRMPAIGLAAVVMGVVTGVVVVAVVKAVVCVTTGVVTGVVTGDVTGVLASGSLGSEIWGAERLLHFGAPRRDQPTSR